MKITKASDYALRVVGFFATAEKNRYYMRNELSEICSVPDSFLGKILQHLVKSGILESERGKKGGFRLSKNPEDITLYDIIRSVEGEIVINECLVEGNACKISGNCKIHNVLDQVRCNLINELKKVNVSNLV
ncbi:MULTISPECIES: RrF2 family transcriptional regulator [Calditerrivibrio]|uniref:Rrf2 family transcriptional regulator n=1 Tax=Calditerrivibrio nitroreducens TaxID=477976 RepID=A0A2J6WRC5_9BACT|nr:MAG: Rrf2 family transcriptional regulator [Calditerrivibrio nitroreducens]